MYYHDTGCCYAPIIGHAVGGENLTSALLLATAFLFDCLKISGAKDVSTTLNRAFL